MYALAESVSIRLRCQRQLLELRKLRLSQISLCDRLQRRNYGPGPSTVLWGEEKPGYDQEDDVGLGQYTNDSRPYQNGRSSVRRADRDIGFKHLDLSQRRIPLGLSSLGEPMEIHVLRDKPGQRRRNQGVVPVEDADQHLVVEELLEKSTPRESFSSMTEAFENLNDICEAKFGSEAINHAPTASQCLQVGQQIHDGFTTSQLQAYFMLFGESNNPQLPTLDGLETIYKTDSFTRSRWFQGASEFPKMAVERLESRPKKKLKNCLLIGPSSTMEDGSTKQTNKQMLVEKILRDCWFIRTAEEKQRNGEVDIQVRTEHLQLLLKHSTS